MKKCINMMEKFTSGYLIAGRSTPTFTLNPNKEALRQLGFDNENSLVDGIYQGNYRGKYVNRIAGRPALVVRVFYPTRKAGTTISVQFEDEEAYEHTLLVVREVSVFKIPPRPTSGGYKCGDWLQSDKIWSGRLRVVSCNTRCEIRLEDPNSGELFAACFVNPGQREAAVESVLDSSRYFVLRIEDGRGKYAFIGLGFNERNEAFDFNVALSDHEKYVKREVEKEVGSGGVGGEGGEEGQIDIHPAVNHRLKEGETIRINVKNKPSSGAGMLSAAGLSAGTGRSKTLSLAPPPSGAAKVRSPLPPPPNDPAAARMTSGSHGTALKGAKENSSRSNDILSDLSQLKKNLPSAAGSESATTSAAGWAAF
ncbi:hypothetical protein Sango_0396500 [Sesamum angolense]|uniref:NECAP PHear domain-containing protein n=1 Tax=Sesamum angolense TaxID=2727404 RepID=A0AAE2C4A6_9LAMI|nr:hypothetical protein Sango_0396500 [Sesamum angolense]